MHAHRQLYTVRSGLYVHDRRVVYTEFVLQENSKTIIGLLDIYTRERTAGTAGQVGHPSKLLFATLDNVII